MKEIKGLIKKIKLIFRISWEFIKKWIKAPAHKKRSALNNAWVIKWKKVKLNIPRLREVIIRPNWLKVDKAIIFLISISKIPFKLLRVSVIREIKSKFKLILLKL